MCRSQSLKLVWILSFLQNMTLRLHPDWLTLLFLEFSGHYGIHSVFISHWSGENRFLMLTFPHSGVCGGNIFPHSSLGPNFLFFDKIFNKIGCFQNLSIIIPYSERNCPHSESDFPHSEVGVGNFPHWQKRKNNTAVDSNPKQPFHLL